MSKDTAVEMTSEKVEELVGKRNAAKSANKVRFASKCGLFTVKSKNYQIVGNPPMKKVVPGITLRFGADGMTEHFDPSNPDHKWVIDETRKLIEKNDRRAVREGLIEVTNKTTLPPVPAWNDMTPLGIKTIVSEGNLDIEKCLVWEEARGSDARLEVIALLVELQEEKKDNIDLDVPVFE